MSTFDLAEYVGKFIDRLPTSAPIFKATGDKRNIHFEVEDSIEHNSNDYEDPLDKLIIENTSETFQKGSGERGSFVNSCSSNSVYKKMLSVVVTTYEGNCGLKNPKSSALYKFLNTNDTREINTGIIALYRYIARHTDVTSRRYDGKSLAKPHVDNVLAILGKMRDKYDR